MYNSGGSGKNEILLIVTSWDDLIGRKVRGVPLSHQTVDGLTGWGIAWCRLFGGMVNFSGVLWDVIGDFRERERNEKFARRHGMAIYAGSMLNERSYYCCTVPCELCWLLADAHPLTPSLLPCPPRHFTRNLSFHSLIFPSLLHLSINTHPFFSSTTTSIQRDFSGGFIHSLGI
jgi:hypothetical protein